MSPILAARLRMSLVMTIFVYPLVTLYLYILMPLTDGWALWQRCLVLVPLMATTIATLVVPMITKTFGGFIAGKKPTAAAN
jgi:antibiotic biosynthesis monooxygenase (ABM) superfamily enzyme